VHPEVIITAAHCEPQAGTQVSFGEDYRSPAMTRTTTACQSHPDYGYYTYGKDIAWCRLDQPVNDVPVVPVMMGCETDALAAGQQMVIVGFGQADDTLGDGPKRAVTTTMNSIQDDEAFIGGNGSDSCYGDSGGPVYVPMADGTWRVFGVTSYGGQCGSGGYYSMMHTQMEWIESTSGIDVTPCHDADGTWNPTGACDSAPTSPGTSSAAWSNGCGDSEMQSVTMTCDGGTGDGDGDGGTSGDGDTGGDSAGSTTAGDGDGDGGSAGEDGSGSGTDGGSAESGTSDGGTSGGDPMLDAEDPKGCGCVAGNSAPPWSLAWLPLLVGLRRRARRHTRIQ
jgi:MYXO-CTERM domain-containing protein